MNHYIDATGALAVAWEWLVLLVLALWAGMLIYEDVAMHGVTPAAPLIERMQKQTHPLHWLCLAALLVGNIVLLLLRAAQLPASPDFAVLGRILFTSSYGTLWLVRVGFIMLAAGLPLLHWRRRHIAAIAHLLLAVLILLTLIYSSFVVAPNLALLPGTKHSVASVVTPSSTGGGTITQSKRAGTLSIALEVTPAKVELANTILVTLMDTRSGKPVENAQITSTTSMQAMDMGTTHITMSGGKPVYRAMFPADSAFSMFGLWNIALLIRQPGHAPVQIVFTILLND